MASSVSGSDSEPHEDPAARQVNDAATKRRRHATFPRFNTMWDHAERRVSTWRHQEPDAQPDAAWLLLVTEEHALLVLLALNSNVWEEQQDKALTQRLAVEELERLCAHTEQSVAPGELPAHCVGGRGLFALRPEERQQMGWEPEHASSALPLMRAWQLSISEQHGVQMELAVRRDGPYHSKDPRAVPSLAVEAGNQEPGAGITAWLHRGCFANVMDAAVLEKQAAGELVPPEWTKALKLHKAALAAREQLLPHAAQWHNLHDPGGRKCRSSTWLEETIAKAKDPVRARPGLQDKHDKWQQDETDCKPQYEAAVAAFDEAYITMHMSKLPYSAVGMTLQIAARSSESIPDVRLNAGRRWIVGDAAALAKCDEVHLPTAVLYTASVQGINMPKH